MNKNQSVKTPSAGLSVEKLRAQFKGHVIGPGDVGYDKARTVFYGGIDKHPAVIIRVADPNDVANAISLAKTSGLALVVRSGGHSFAGYCVCDDGIVIDLCEMRKLDIESDKKTAWAQTGLTAIEATNAADTQFGNWFW